MDIQPTEYSELPVGYPKNWEQAEEFVSCTYRADSPSVVSTLAYSDDLCSCLDNSESICAIIPSLCRSKEGSIQAQHLLSAFRPEQFTELISLILHSLHELILDPYGNYTIQCLFENCSAGQRLFLLKTLENELVAIARHPKGTHGLQTLVSMCSTLEEELIYKRVFKGKVLELARDVNASRVVQKLLGTVKNRHVLVGELLGHTYRLAIDKIGLCVIKVILNDPQVLDELMENALELMQDPYGNYAMQILVDIWKEEVSFPVICAIKGKVAQLCIQKYSSNVIEQCLKEENMRNFILEELLNEAKLEVLLGSPYGCYVLRTAAKSIDRGMEGKFCPVLINAIQRFSYKNLKSRWDEILFYLH